jgi:hypothetical protein
VAVHLSGAGARAYELADSPAATAKPSTATSPAVTLAFSFASGIIAPTNMTIRAPAAKPSPCPLYMPSRVRPPRERRVEHGSA